MGTGYPLEQRLSIRKQESYLRDCGYEDNVSVLVAARQDVEVSQIKSNLVNRTNV